MPIASDPCPRRQFPPPRTVPRFGRDRYPLRRPKQTLHHLPTRSFRRHTFNTMDLCGQTLCRLLPPMVILRRLLDRNISESMPRMATIPTGRNPCRSRRPNLTLCQLLNPFIIQQHQQMKNGRNLFRLLPPSQILYRLPKQFTI